MKCNHTTGLPICGFILRFTSNIWNYLGSFTTYTYKPPNSEWLEVDLSRSLKVKCGGAVGLPICDFLLVLNSNAWRNSGHLRDIRLQNLSDLGAELSGSLKSNVIAQMEVPINASILMFNGNIWPNSALLRHIMLRNLGDLDFHLSRSLKIKCVIVPSDSPYISY